MTRSTPFLARLESLVERYLAEVASKRERLAVLRWQLAEEHALDQRTTLPGHITTSAIILSPDRGQVLLIDHVAIGRWLQPGGHYEPARLFHQSAAREAVEETGVAGLALHPWHGVDDVPFVIDSHDVPGRAARHEPDHVHHDLQYLFGADPAAPLTAQREEVRAAMWKPVSALAEISPKAAERLGSIAA